jgi:methionyl aminopeptidase
MIKYKNPKDIDKMQQGGQILKEVLSKIMLLVKPGVSLANLDQSARRMILEKGAEPSFERVKNYRWTICSCVNNVVVHGIPGEYKLKAGDVVGIDCGVFFQGFHTDSAWTVYLPGGSKARNQEIRKFLNTGETALEKAIKQVKPGNYIWDISKTIQSTVESSGYSIVRTLVGHGVGRQLHEDPEVPGFVSSFREATPVLKPGMVLAIEIIYNMGSPEIVYQGNDGWTIVTKDGKISGLFEATVATVSHGCLVLSKYGAPRDS